MKIQQHNKRKGMGRWQKKILLLMTPQEGEATVDFTRLQLQEAAGCTVWQARSALRGLLARDLVECFKPERVTGTNLWRLKEQSNGAD